MIQGSRPVEEASPTSETPSAARPPRVPPAFRAIVLRPGLQAGPRPRAHAPARGASHVFPLFFPSFLRKSCRPAARPAQQSSRARAGEAQSLQVDRKLPGGGHGAPGAHRTCGRAGTREGRAGQDQGRWVACLERKRLEKRGWGMHSGPWMCSGGEVARIGSLLNGGEEGGAYGRARGWVFCLGWLGGRARGWRRREATKEGGGEAAAMNTRRRRSK